MMKNEKHLVEEQMVRLLDITRQEDYSGLTQEQADLRLQRRLTQDEPDSRAIGNPFYNNYNEARDSYNMEGVNESHHQHWVQA